MAKKALYVPEPEDKTRFTEDFNRFYSAFARLYDLGVQIAPFWKRWLKSTLPYIRGPRVLEISFGTGFLMAQYAGRYEAYGLDYNDRFARLVGKKLERVGIAARLCRGDVQALPYRDEYFHTIVNTMAFSGYPDGIRAMSEMQRVLAAGGRLVMVDIAYPLQRNRLGFLATRAWIALGDIIREMGPLFDHFGFSYSEKEIGGFGSVHLYVAEKG